MLITLLMMVVGAVAGAATPTIAARFGVVVRANKAWFVVGGLAGATLGWALTPSEALVWSLILAVGVPLAAIDLGARRLPDALVLPAAVAAVVLAVAGGASGAVFGGLLLVTLYALLAVLPGSALGFGDVKLAGPLGVALAVLGWSALAWGTALAFVSGGLVAAVLLLTRRATRATPLPFGPHMLVGALLAAVLFGSAGEGVEQAVDVFGGVVEVRRGA